MSTLRSIRLYPTETEFLSQYRMNNGDVFYDKDRKTLVLYDGQTKSGIPLLRADLENAETGLGVAVSENPPNNSRAGSLWFDVKSGELFIYVDDGDSEQWVQPSGPVFSVSQTITPPYVLPTASANVLGGVRVDGTTITISNGVISSSGGNNSGITLNSLSAINGNPSGSGDLSYNSSTGVFTFSPPDFTTFLADYATQTFVNTAVSNLVNSAPTTLDTLNELAAALGNDENFATTVSTALGLKAPINNPTFTGTVTIPEGANIAGYAPINDPTFAGDVIVNSSTTVTTNFTFLSFGRSAVYGTIVMTTTEPGILALTGGDLITMNFAEGAPLTQTVLSVDEYNVGEITITYSNGQLSGISPPDGSILVSLVVPRIGTITVNGLTTLQQSTEVLNVISFASSTVTHNFSTGAIWYHSSISANFTANFTNVPTTTDRAISLVLVLVQGATPYIPNAVQIDGAAQTILWQDNTVPTGNANKRDLASFTLVRTGSTWTVLGSLSTYG